MTLISELAKLLLNNKEVKDLSLSAISKVGPDRFQRNFSRLLKIYSQRLKAETSNKLQHQSASFTGGYAPQTAAEMARLLYYKGIVKQGITIRSNESTVASTNDEDEISVWSDSD